MIREQTSPTETPDAGASGHGLSRLVERLKGMGEPPAFEELDALLAGVEVGAEELRPHVSFKEATYARHRVHLGEHAELLVLCWRPGQRTPIHDHAGSYGAVKVLRGVMWETLFEIGEGGEGLAYKSSR